MLPVNYLDRAVSALRKLGISMQMEQGAPLVAILEKIARYDNAKVASIAATLQQSSSFNATVRDQIAGMDILAHAAHCADGQHPLHAELFETVDVGAEIQGRRGDAVPPAMAGQKDHVAALQRARDIGVRRRPKRCLDLHFLHILQPRHGVETAAADDADFSLLHQPHSYAVPRLNERPHGSRRK